MNNIIDFLPDNWEAKAKELGAMQRDSGVIRSAKSLLRLNMLYTTNDGSFQMASLGMAMTERVAISKNSCAKRIRNSGEWLRWMAQELCAAQRATIEKPAFLGDKDVLLVDATDEITKGKNKDTWRLHYIFNLFDFSTVNVELTTNKEGERLTRYKDVLPNSIYIADRIYCTMSGIEHICSNDADFLLRFKSKAFNLYDETGGRICILSLIKADNLCEYQNTNIHCFYKLACGTLRPIRIVAMKKNAKAIAESKRKMERKVSKKQEEPVCANTIELNEYIVLATSLDYTNEQILELYRTRWQIEQVFYRLKSLFGYDNVPSKRDDTVKAWFYGKLMLAALCERILKDVPFPPELETKVVDIIRAQFVG